MNDVCEGVSWQRACRARTSARLCPMACGDVSMDLLGMYLILTSFCSANKESIGRIKGRSGCLIIFRCVLVTAGIFTNVSKSVYIVALAEELFCNATIKARASAVDGPGKFILGGSEVHPCAQAKESVSGR